MTVVTEPAYYSLFGSRSDRRYCRREVHGFRNPDRARRGVSLSAGQFLTLRIAYVERYLPRGYSLASCPLLQEPLRVTTKRATQGLVSNWICDQIKAGDAIEVKPPAGHSTPRSLDDDFLLFAGGSGITFGGIAGGRVDSVGAMCAARACALATGRLGGSCRRGAAIDHVNAAGAVAALIRCEEQDHVCDFFGSPVAPEGKRALELFLGLTWMTGGKLFFD